MIKCFEPNIEHSDINKVSEVLKSKILGFGENVNKFEKEYKKFSNKTNNIGTSSASAAAYIIFEYLYEKYGECVVYTPSLAFVSPVYAALKNQHKIVYVDVDQDLLMCGDHLKKIIKKTDKHIVVMPILYGGVSQIKDISEIAKEYKATVVVDSAHCISSKMDSDYDFYSFHSVKPVCMSNGGLVATNEDPEYFLQGRNFGRKQISDSYDLVQPGFNFYLNNLNATIGLSQLEKCLKNVNKRKSNFNFLKNNLDGKIGRFTNHDEGSSYYLCSVILKPELESDKMREYLEANGVQASFHYPFLHKTKQYFCDQVLENLESYDNKIINLPIHQNLSDLELEKIVNECISYSRSRC